jgi:hypothetical protein
MADDPTALPGSHGPADPSWADMARTRQRQDIIEAVKEAFARANLFLDNEEDRRDFGEYMSFIRSLKEGDAVDLLAWVRDAKARADAQHAAHEKALGRRAATVYALAPTVLGVIATYFFPTWVDRVWKFVMKVWP